MSFDKEVERVFAIEKGYVNDPSDSGGETNFGITVAVARENGFTSPMSKMTKENARYIYKRKYWDSLQLDTIDALAPDIAGELFDTGVNQGVYQAGMYLQKCLNVLNNSATLWPDLTEDAAIGKKTIDALSTFYALRGKDGLFVLFTMLNVLQGAYYIDLARSRQKDEKYVYGWFKNRVVLYPR